MAVDILDSEQASETYVRNLGISLAIKAKRQSERKSFCRYHVA